MNHRFWIVLGLINIAIPPISLFTIATILYTNNLLLPTNQLVAASYPLGLLFLLFVPLGCRPGTHITPEMYVEYAHGARYGVFLVSVVSIPFGLFWGIGFHQYTMGESIILLSLGSLWLPGASAAGAYGYLVANAKVSDNFFRKAQKNPLNNQSTAIVFLGLFLRTWDLLRKWGRALYFQLLFLSAYLYGWIILSLTGGFPATLVGLGLSLLIPSSALVTFRRLVSPEGKKRLSNILQSRRPFLPAQ